MSEPDEFVDTRSTGERGYPAGGGSGIQRCITNSADARGALERLEEFYKLKHGQFNSKRNVHEMIALMFRRDTRASRASRATSFRATQGVVGERDLSRADAVRVFLCN